MNIEGAKFASTFSSTVLFLDRSTIYSTGDVPNMFKAKKKYSFHASQSKKKSHKNSTISHTEVRAVKMYK